VRINLSNKMIASWAKQHGYKLKPRRTVGFAVYEGSKHIGNVLPEGNGFVFLNPVDVSIDLQHFKHLKI
jgi:hypothetical protein